MFQNKNITVTKPLKIYELDVTYNKFLCSFDSKVHRPIGKNYIYNVPYIGIIEFINDKYYLLPLSSDKNEIFHSKNEDQTFELVKVPQTDSNEYKIAGVIRIANAIPINNFDLSKIINPYELSDKNRANLLIYELNWINKYRNDVINKSINCLSNKISFEEKQFVCNFKLLERAAKVYDEKNILVQERINSYPKVYTEKENEDFFKKMKEHLAINNFQNESNTPVPGGTPTGDDPKDPTPKDTPPAGGKDKNSNDKKVDENHSSDEHKDKLDKQAEDINLPVEKKKDDSDITKISNDQKTSNEDQSLSEYKDELDKISEDINLLIDKQKNESGNGSGGTPTGDDNDPFVAPTVKTAKPKVKSKSRYIEDEWQHDEGMSMETE